MFEDSWFKEFLDILGNSIACGVKVYAIGNDIFLTIGTFSRMFSG